MSLSLFLHAALLVLTTVSVHAFPSIEASGDAHSFSPTSLWSQIPSRDTMISTPIILFPNPALDHITIKLRSSQSEWATLVIFNAHGEQVADLSERIARADLTKPFITSLDVSALATGAYFVRATTTIAQVVLPFVVVH